MEDLIQTIKKFAPKGRFSLYHKPEETLVRIYFKNGSQHREIGSTLEEALQKMVNYLEM